MTSQTQVLTGQIKAQNHMIENVSEFRSGYSSIVEPLLNGHPRGVARWPLNRGMLNMTKIQSNVPFMYLA